MQRHLVPTLAATCLLSAAPAWAADGAAAAKHIVIALHRDGIEIHVDGKMLEPGLHGDSALHAGHGAMHKRAEVIC